jgi:hypothetical protein
MQCIPVVIISAFLDLEKTLSFSDSLLGRNSIHNESVVQSTGFVSAFGGTEVHLNQMESGR